MDDLNTMVWNAEPKLIDTGAHRIIGVNGQFASFFQRWVGLDEAHVDGHAIEYLGLRKELTDAVTLILNHAVDYALERQKEKLRISKM